jgi:nitroreductase
MKKQKAGTPQSEGAVSHPALEIVLARRSIRRYAPQPVPADLVDSLLAAAMAAPSAGNQQPWQFIVSTKRSLLDRVPDCHPYAYMMTEAKLGILVCADLTQVTNEGFWVQDCSAATQNLLIAAQALGLGAVWLGVYPREERVSGLRHLFSVPDHVVPFALVALGFPAEQKPPAGRFDRARIHDETW